MTDTTSPVIVRPQLWAVIVAVIIGGLFYVYGKNMDLHSSTSAPFLISVSADDKVSASPDIAVTSFGVQTGRQPTVKAAMELLTKSMTKVLAAVKAAGLEDKDITTESFWLSPVFDYVNGSQLPRGYEAHQSLSVKIRDLDKIGDVLSAATAAGANQGGGISFSIDKPDVLQGQARAKAIVKARAKAQELADELGMSTVSYTHLTLPTKRIV